MKNTRKPFTIYRNADYKTRKRHLHLPFYDITTAKTTTDSFHFEYSQERTRGA